MKIRNMLVAAAVLVGVTAAPAVAQTKYVGGKTEVKGNTETRPAPLNPGAQVSGAGDSRSSGAGGLPITGGDMAGLTALGLAAVGTGSVLVRRSRRRPVTA